jgi:hypothetical protein
MNIQKLKRTAFKSPHVLYVMRSDDLGGVYYIGAHSCLGTSYNCSKVACHYTGSSSVIADLVELQPDELKQAETKKKIEDEDWEAVFLHQREVVAGGLARAADLVPRFAIFLIAPIPLIIHLGFLFSDRVETELFQFDRDRGDWSWPNEQSETAGQVPELVGEPESEVAGEGDAVLRVSLSELVRAADTQAVVPNPLVELAIGIGDPDKQWLQSPEQLSHLRELYLEALKSIRRKVPGCGRLHVFYAGPAAGAFLLGQCVNPRMDPEIAVYEYSRQREPRYRLAGVLTEEGAL